MKYNNKVTALRKTGYLKGEMGMEHFITEIKIDHLRHLSDIVIPLNTDERQHLLITGKNGSGKTSLLLALQKYLLAINDGMLTTLKNTYIPELQKAETALQAAKTENEKLSINKQYEIYLKPTKKYHDGIMLSFSDESALDFLYKEGNFITAFFPANRKIQIVRGHGVEDVQLDNTYDIHSTPGTLLHKYMVHLKTQQAYARNEGDTENTDRIQKWFDRFVGALRILLDDSSLTLEYDYKKYDFKIHEQGRIPFGLDELSDGYSSVIHIVSDLILRMEQNWLLGNSLSEYNIEGIVLIDELETHLHIELQKNILPFLTSFFPRIQFIITTHSPYILNSISNATAYDLERCVALDQLSLYSSESLAEGYFESDEYATELKQKLERYQYLTEKTDPTEEERAERARLRKELKDIPKGFSPEARDKFEDIEAQRR